MSLFSLKSGSFDWTGLVSWLDFKLSVRDLGVVANFPLEVGDLLGVAPIMHETFELTLPHGERFVLYATCAPSVPVYASDGDELAVVFDYECVDPLTHLDWLPLPEMEFFGQSAGAIIKQLIAQMDSSLDTSGIQPGNTVAYLSTKEFSKFSDIMRAEAIATGDYILLIDPTTGLRVIGDYKTSMGDSGVFVDYLHPDYSPMGRDKIEPNNEIVNRQTVRGNAAGGPDHTVNEAREIDAKVATFRLKRKPYGLDESELLNVQFDGGQITGDQGSGLPAVIPLHYPTIITVSDIAALGAPGEICSFVGNNNLTLLGCYVGAGTIGAVVNGAVYATSLPLNTAGAAPDQDHQYRYNWTATFTSGGLEIVITEFYLDNTAGSVALMTVTDVDVAARKITVSGDATTLPASVRFYDGSPDNVVAVVNVVDRGSNYIVVDQIPRDGSNAPLIEPGLTVASGEPATTTQTETRLDVPAPAGGFGKPVIVKSSGAGISVRSWTASYGPAVDGELLSDPAQGVVGRKLRFDTIASAGVDFVISAQGDSAICTRVADRLPTSGSLKIILNYDAAKQAEYTAVNQASIDECGLHTGNIIQSDYAVTVEDCQAFAEAIVADRGEPSPRGTIIREWSECPRFPMPGMAMRLNLPDAFGIPADSAPISEVSVDFKGYDPFAAEPVVFYHMAIGEPNAEALVERDLLTREQSTGTAYRPRRASGPRISGFTWNDKDNVTLSVGGAVTIGGSSVGASFDPAQFASGDLREAPVQISGSIDGKHELFVEVIYSPLPVNPASVTCSYNPRSNTITFHWARPGGAISYPIDKQQDTDNDPETVPTWEKFDEIFTTAIEVPYDPLSKVLRVQTVGLGDKTGGEPVEITCVLPKMPAPSPFEVVKVQGSADKVVLRSQTFPTGREFRGRTEHLVIFVYSTPDATITVPENPDEWLNFFDPNKEGVERFMFKVTPDKQLSRFKVDFTDTDADDQIFISGAFVDRFGDFGDMVEPFDATNPPMTAPHIEVGDFFRSATQAAGGAIEDDDEYESGLQVSHTHRVHLGKGNDRIQLVLEVSDAMPDYATTPTWSGRKVKEEVTVTGQDVANGYVDIDFTKKISWAKHKIKTVRPYKIVATGAKIRERIGPEGEEQVGRQTLHVVGYTGTPPAIEKDIVDAVFDMTPFYFQPLKSGLANTFYQIVTGDVKIKPTNDGFIFDWNIPNEPGLRRYIMLIHTAPFSTRGPGNATDIATATAPGTLDAQLDAFTGEGTLTVWNNTNSARDLVVSAKDVDKAGRIRFRNGDIIANITISKTTTYYVSLIAQKKNGRWSPNFAPVLNTSSGKPVGVGAPSIAPRVPVAADLTTNAVDLDTVVADAKLGFKVDTADGTTTFAAANVADVTVQLKEVGGSQIYELHAVTAGSTATTITAYGNMPLGKAVTVDKVYFTNGEGSTTASPSSTITLTSGRVKIPAISTDIAFSGSPSITSTDQRDPHHATIKVGVTQPSLPTSILDPGPIYVKHAVLRHKLTSEGTFIKANEINLTGVEDFFTPGAKTLEFTVKHKPGKSYDYEIKFIGVGDVTRIFSLSGLTTGTDINVPPATLPTNPSNATLLFPENVLVGDWASGQARIRVRIETSNGTSFATNNISEAYAHFRLTGTTGEKTIRFGGQITDRSQTFIEVTGNLPIGLQYDWLKNSFHNGDQMVESTGSAVAFWSARYKFPTSTSEIPTPSIVGFQQKGNKKAVITVRTSQRTLGTWDNVNPLSILKTVRLDQDENDGLGFVEEKKDNLLKEEALLANGGTFDSVFTVQHKDGASRRYQAFVKGGGGSSAIWSNGSSISNPGTTGTFADAPTDTVAPDAPSVRASQSGSRWHVTCGMPTVGNNTRLEYQIVLVRAASLAAITNPGSTPTEGVGQVVLVRDTNTGESNFKVGRVPISVDANYYSIFARVRNASLSTWSSWTQYNLGFRFSNSFTRELEDDVGTGVPTIDTAVGINGWSNWNPATHTLSGTRALTAITIDWEWVDQPNGIRNWYIQFRLKTNDPNYMSLRSVEYQIWKRSNGKLKFDQPIPPGARNVVPLTEVNWVPIVRWRCQNRFLDDGAHPDGFSDYSFYADGLDGDEITEGGFGATSTPIGGLSAYPDKGIA